MLGDKFTEFFTLILRLRSKRSGNNFLINIISALVAYCFSPKKPSLKIEFEPENNQLWLAA
jgi:hypothetical protein